MTDASILPTGTVFGRYRIERLLGRGGMGAVYAAEQLEDGRQVAVKVLTTGLGSAEDRERFIREGRVAASINHPNTVYVYRTEEIDGSPTITMELVEGGTLEEKVERLGPLSVAEAIKDILQIVDGLDAAQRIGILHRDIKPANCFVAPNGDIKVGDFGLSRPVDEVDSSRLTKTGLFLGTPVYSSPEQLMGEALDVRSDIYAVGATLYFLLSGKLPFDADNAVRLIAAVMSSAPTPLVKHRPDIPEAVNVLVMRCLARKREERFADYGALRDALIGCQPEEMVPAPILRRIVAGAVDAYAVSAISTPIFFTVTKAMGMGAMDLTKDASAQWLQMAFSIPFELLWFAVIEGRFGWSPGKLLLGLRVSRLEGGPPGMAKGTLRALAYTLPGVVAALAAQPVSDPIARAYVIQIAYVLALIALFVRARRANGFLAEHDRLTGTRVVRHRKARAVQRTTQEFTTSVTTSRASTGRIGPYDVIEPVPSSADVVEGYDAELRRVVWIVRHPEGTAPVSVAHRQMVRVGCLRWIGGKREGAESWDAYAAVTGKSLRRRLMEATSWEEVHDWLKDIVNELRTREDPSAEQMRLSIDYVWISNEGRAILLPFPVSDGEQPSRPTAALLKQFVDAVRGAQNQASHQAAWPLRARTLLQRAASTSDLDAFASELSDADGQIEVMSRKRRVALWSAIAVPMLAISAVSVVSTLYVLPQDPNHTRMEPLLGYLTAKRNRVDSLAQKRELVGTYLAGHFREVITTSNRTSANRASASALSKQDWRRLDSILLAHPRVDATALRAADQLVDSTWHGAPPGQVGRRKLVPVFAFLGFVFFTAAFSLLSAIFARRGLAMRLLGLDLVNQEGDPAGRLRLVWRQVLIVAPLLVVASVPLFIVRGATVVQASIGVIACGFVVASILTALREPSRGLTEQLSGTRIVPE